LLLALVQIGRMITGDGMVSRFGLEESESQFSKRESDIARSGTLRAKTAGDFADRTLSSSGGFAPPPASEAAESNKKADITRLPARAPTDMVTKMPASIAGLPQTAARSAKVAPPQEKEESSAENDTAMAVMAPPEPAG